VSPFRKLEEMTPREQDADYWLTDLVRESERLGLYDDPPAPAEAKDDGRPWYHWLAQESFD